MESELRTMMSSVRIIQLTRQDTVLSIPQINLPLSLNFTEIAKSRFIPVDFNISYCDDAIQTENFSIFEEGTLIPAESIPIYELYAQYSAFVNFEVQLLANFSTSECPATFLVLNNIDEYESFLQNGTWTISEREYCIKSGNFSIDITLTNNFFFFGIHIENYLNVQEIRYHVNGSREVRRASSSSSLCSLTLSTTECAANFDGQSDVCVVANISKGNFTDELMTAEIHYIYTFHSSQEVDINSVVVLVVPNGLLFLALVSFAVILLLLRKTKN